MHPRRGALRGGAAALSLALVAVAPAGAQGFAVFGQGGYFSMTAADSAKAVFDSSGGPTFGGGLSYGIGRHFYVEGAFRQFSKEGERVFVASAGSPVFKLGFPLEARLRPVYGTVGFRFPLGKSAFVPYVGVGAGSTSYREQSLAQVRYEWQQTALDMTMEIFQWFGYEPPANVIRGIQEKLLARDFS